MSALLRPRAKDTLQRIAPYVGGKAKADGTANRTIKLSSNENPHGCSPDAAEALREAAGSLHLYPDGGASALREAIGEAEGLDPARIVCGAGSDEIISLLCLAYAGEGEEVLHSAHGFLMYAISAKAAGADPVTAPETDLTADVDALLAAATERTRLVFLANPNNPTGTLLPASEVRRLREGLPGQALLVLDAAYAEYVEREDYDPGHGLVDERIGEGADDVVMTRTFSKVHGLGALRLGWCYGPPDVIDALNRARGPFNVSGPAQAAGAAAIRDTAFVERSRRENREQRARLAEALAARGFGVTPSEGNFLLAECRHREAADVDAHLQSEGILVRRMEGYGLPGHLRISIGTRDEVTALIEALDRLP